jgi:hypothetical protein
LTKKSVKDETSCASCRGDKTEIREESLLKFRLVVGVNIVVSCVHVTELVHPVAAGRREEGPRRQRTDSQNAEGQVDDLTPGKKNEEKMRHTQESLNETEFPRRLFQFLEM